MNPTTRASTGRQTIWHLLLLFLVALLARIIIVLILRFDGLYGQDPFAYYNYSLELRQAFSQLRPPPPFFWPIGYPLLVVFATLVAGSRPLAGQLVSIISGALIAPLLYLIICEVKPGARAGGLVAGLLAALSGQLMLSSTAVMSDAAALAWVTLSAWAMLRYTKVLRAVWLILSAFTLGLAVLTRWGAALAALPWAFSAFLAWQAACWPWRRIASVAVLAVFIGGLVLLFSFIPSLVRGELSHVGDLMTVGWNPANAVKSTITNSDGVFRYERPIGLFYALPAVHPAFIYPLLTPFMILGLWSLRDRPRPHSALLIGWPLIVYIFLAGIAWQNPRFSLALFPPQAVLVGLGFQQAWEWKRRLSRLDKEQRHRPLNFLLRYWRPILIAWSAFALVGSLAWSVGYLRDFTTLHQSRITAAQWLEEQVPVGATVISFGLTQTIDYRTDLEVEEIYNLDETSLAGLIAARSPTYLFLDLNHIQSQWLGKSPQLNVQWLSENTKMSEFGHFPPYTLYHIEHLPSTFNMEPSSFNLQP